MVYTIALWAAVAILAVGLLHRIDAWFMVQVGDGDRRVGVGERVAAGLKGLLAAVFSLRLVSIVKVLILDVLLQWRILKDRKDPLAWVMHLAIFWGFVLLVVFHALGSLFAGLIAPSYVSTLNPFLFLRNLAGALLLVGLGLAVLRRRVFRRDLATTSADVVPILLLLVMTVSGFLLETTKITSPGAFDQMVTEYGGGLGADETTALSAYWAAEFGTVPASPVASHGPTVIAQGKVVHEALCQSCHTRTTSAFVSYPLARAIAPVAVGLDRAGARTGLWVLHILSCVFGLTYLAFSKMFHMVSTPVSLMVAEVAGRQQRPAVAAVRQMIELDGCSHGGACHEQCPVRLRRLDRISSAGPYEPMLEYLGHKSASELGSRPVAS